MKTRSCWGSVPSRLYQFIRLLRCSHGNHSDVCVVGCADGKFVMPFLRQGFHVTAIDMDKCALYGGEKESPVKRAMLPEIKYVSCMEKPRYEKIPCTLAEIPGLKKRAEDEGLSGRLFIQERDFYRNPPEQAFDAVFTSCSIQYKHNRNIPVSVMIHTLCDRVRENGYLYMDYMMPLEDRHDWKSSGFLRTGEILRFFGNEWKILHKREMKNPVLERAHIDRPEDHFHRFGYILARKRP